MKGRQWEAHIAIENQREYSAGRAMVARIPTHYHGGIPSRDPKVDFVGVIEGGRMVAIEAKANSGALSKMQREYLAASCRMGALAIVYRYVDHDRHVCTVDADGKMQRRSGATRVLPGETWLDAAYRRNL